MSKNKQNRIIKVKAKAKVKAKYRIICRKVTLIK